jgi:hypothetical protein
LTSRRVRAWSFCKRRSPEPGEERNNVRGFLGVHPPKKGRENKSNTWIFRRKSCLISVWLGLVSFEWVLMDKTWECTPRKTRAWTKKGGDS